MIEFANAILVCYILSWIGVGVLDRFVESLDGFEEWMAASHFFFLVLVILYILIIGIKTIIGG